MKHTEHHDAHWDAVDEAVELLREHDHEGALRELGAALDKDPSNPYAHYFVGAVHYEREEWEAARKAYEEAMKHAPDYLGAIVGRGHALRQLGRFDEAIRMGERALELSDEKHDPDAHFLLALTYAAKGEKRRAIVHVEEFLRTNPEVEARYEAEALLQTLQGKAKPLEPV
jgi:tetratricopeptide (TPR) repeat protein